jgi:hypothetical protein
MSLGPIGSILSLALVFASAGSDEWFRPEREGEIVR